jgi:hypothetical protein
MTPLLVLKLVLTPLLIAGVSLAGRRWGPSISGWLSALPLISAPTVAFLLIDQGADFAARAAAATLVGLLSLGLFCLLYAQVARRAGLLPSLLAGWAAFFLTTAVLQAITLSPPLEAVLVPAGLLGIVRILPRGAPGGGRVVLPWWDIPLRMALATGFIIALTEAAALLGPRLSGLLTPFPVFASILTLFNHHFQGAPAATHFLRGILTASGSAFIFLLLMAVLLESWGGWAFAVALPATLAAHGVALWALRRPPSGSSRTT